LNANFGEPDLPDGPERYVAAFRYIVDKFRKNGATNVKFCWGPGQESFPKTSWNTLENLYPGDDVVDLICPSIYHVKGQKRTADEDYNFEVGPFARAHGKDVIIGEYGVYTSPSDMVWYSVPGLALLVENNPEIKGVVWFNSGPSLIDQEIADLIIPALDEYFR